VRLIDVRTGSTVQQIVGHAGAVLSVAWSPKNEHILASGGTDGTVRIWDIRRSAPQLSVLDMDDAVGIGGYNGNGLGARRAGRGKAHAAAVNGIVWTEDARHIVSCGHDERIRVWDTKTYANTLANFGPLVKNAQLNRLLPCLAQTTFSEPSKDVLFFPSEKEILMYELFEGKLIKRLKALAPTVISQADIKVGKNTANRRVKDLAWRRHSIELYSAHSDGSIRAWKPRTRDEAREDEEDDDAEEQQKKRKALDDIYQDLMKKRML
jgi:DNA excision repair protein ERCC-8